MIRVPVQLGLLPPLLFAVAGGCAGAKADGYSPNGSGGSGGSDCLTISCVPPPSNPLSFAAEITPPVASGAPLTELIPVQAGGAYPLTLATDLSVSIVATFTATSSGTVPGNANILLDVPSQIPGRPDLTFQAPATAGTAMTGPASTTAQLAVPQTLVKNGSSATLSLLPFSPDDQLNPPCVVSGLTLNSSLQLPETLPAGNLAIGGSLVNSVAQVPSDTFVARAFQGSTLVSSAPLISPTGNGTFQLLIPSTVTPDAGPVTIQLTSQNQNDPWFVFAPFQLPNPPVPSLSIGTVMLAPYLNVNQFNVVVQGMDLSPVNGATVLAQTTLVPSSISPSSMYKGTTNFARSAMTDAQGTAVLSLIPGPVMPPVYYSLVAVPPSGSAWATTCSDPAHPIQVVNTAGAQPVATLKLNPRTVLTGKVTDANGRGVANVTITATPGSAPTGNCASTPAASASTTTDSQGTYTLPLDPGALGPPAEPAVYQLDYDPPAGSSAPRATETGVEVMGTGPIQHYLQLPPGGLVAGTVFTASQAPLPSSTVRLFQPQCPSTTNCSTPPLLLGQGVSDTNGHFQIVVPLHP